jgi:hypothetical protein
MTREDEQVPEMTRRGRGWSETGMVTAELAVGLISFLLVLAVILSALRAGMDRAGAASVAGLVAREAAHSGPAGAGELWSELRSRLPAGSTMTVGQEAGFMVVRVSVPVRGGLAAAALPDTVGAEAVARDEGP